MKGENDGKLILIFINNIRIYHYRIFRAILNSNKYHLRYHSICQSILNTSTSSAGSPAAAEGDGLVLSTSTTSTSTSTSTSPLFSKEKEVKEEIKVNGIFKHDQQQHGDEGGEVYEGEEGEEEEEDVVFVIGGTDFLDD